ncbi:hypothetical protein ACNQGP_07770 [Flavobacterium sp. GT2N3]
MKKSIFLLVLLCGSTAVFSQQVESTFDEKLAKSLKANDYGMKQ